MYRSKKVEEMAAEISANIERLENQLKEEYKRFIRFSPEFDDIAIDLVLLKRETLSNEMKEYEATTITDRLLTKLDTRFGLDRDNLAIRQAALDVVDEYAAETIACN